jgi:6-phosphogluconolactonase
MAHAIAGRTLAFVGTLNRPAPYFAAANGPGLAVLAFDDATGALTPLHETGGIDNPSYLTVDAAGRTLYAVSEVAGWHEGVTTAYRIDPDSAALRYIDKQPTRGSIAAYASFDRTGHWLLVANYRMGEDGLRPPQAAVVYPIENDGGLGAPVASVGHTGHGPNPDRQEGPHPHCVLASPDNRFVLIADLGLDRIVVYAFDADTGALTPAPTPFVQLAPGAGPRHLAFHPSRRFVHVTNELASSVTTLAWDGGTGTLSPLQTVSALPDGWTAESHCSDIAVSPDGRFLYAANRGHDSIAMFAIDTATGRLASLGHHSTLGRTPRQFTLDLTGRFLLIANQNADAVVVLSRDPDSGLLSDSGQRAAIGTPMCVKLVRMA